MSSQFVISDVSAEFIMNLAKVIATSPHPLGRDDLLRSFDASEGYIKNSISLAMQLGLINFENGGFVSSELGSIIQRSNKTELYLSLGQALQKYAPFLIYMDFLSKGYSSTDAAYYTRGIFRIQAKENIVEKAFRNWGLFLGS